jgi:tetratricopeptide (TPR) repeat protein
MTRLARYRLGWVVMCLLLSAAVVVLFVRTGSGPLLLFLIGLLLLVPGRVQGVLWRDFFRGTRHLREQRFREAVEALERFRARVAAQPGLKRAIWLAWPGYSADIEAMTLTNLGMARLNLGAADEAERALNAAIALDAQSALAWFNLGMVHTVRHEAEFAARAFAEAHRLGYRGNALDRAQAALSGALTRVEG